MKALYPVIAAVLLSAAGCATTRNDEIVRTVPPDASISSDAAWKTIDLDGNDSLSLSELEQQSAMGLLQDLDTADANGDHAVSREEWDLWWPRMTNHHIRPAVSTSANADLAP